MLPYEHSTLLQPKSIWRAENCAETCSPVENILHVEPMEVLSMDIINLIIDFLLLKSLRSEDFIVIILFVQEK